MQFWKHAWAMQRLGQPPFHRVRLSDGGEVFAEVGEGNVEVLGIELHAHEEEAGFLISVLVGMEDVAAVPVDEVGDGGDFALAVGAGNQEYGGVLHSSKAITTKDTKVHEGLSLCARCVRSVAAIASTISQFHALHLPLSRL